MIHIIIILKLHPLNWALQLLKIKIIFKLKLLFKLWNLHYDFNDSHYEYFVANLFNLAPFKLIDIVTLMEKKIVFLIWILKLNIYILII